MLRMLTYRPSKAWRQVFGEEDANGAQQIQISERTSEISSLVIHLVEHLHPPEILKAAALQ
jgi:hypothetical protein